MGLYDTLWNYASFLEEDKTFEYLKDLSLIKNVENLMFFMLYFSGAAMVFFSLTKLFSWMVVCGIGLFIAFLFSLALVFLVKTFFRKWNLRRHT
ncbi:hypothetical protein KY333_05195 [Candidatus Woesearchaeota archaeon]|nr:hypothetical protein [Candidatus Woesearchaeota archaeon]